MSTGRQRVIDAFKDARMEQNQKLENIYMCNDKVLKLDKVEGQDAKFFQNMFEPLGLMERFETLVKVVEETAGVQSSVAAILENEEKCQKCKMIDKCFDSITSVLHKILNDAAMASGITPLQFTTELWDRFEKAKGMEAVRLFAVITYITEEISV